MIALHTLVGIIFLSIPAAFICGRLVLSRRPPSWLLRYRGWTDRASPLTRRFIAYLDMTILFLATFAGLNLAFDFHPLGADYRRPWTYLNAILPFLLADFLVYRFSQPKKFYSAVADDWLLWGGRTEETTKHSL